LLASARVGIMLTLKYFHDSQYISIFPYASQCVVKAAFLAEKAVHTPLPNEPREIVYNQWGLHQNQIIHSNIFLEDSADSFYPLGGTVCKTNSRFEIWSFPKLLGTTFGGIVWCRSKSDALALKEIRSNLPKQNFSYQLLLSIFRSKSRTTYQIWENYEFSHPLMNKSQVKILSVELDRWASTYLKMRTKYQEALQKVPSTNFPGSQELDISNFGVIPTVIECKSPVEIESARELSRVYTNGAVKCIYVYAYQKEISTK